MTRIKLLIAALVVLASACATSINHVLADPGRYRNRDVSVSGTVRDSYSVADRGVYRLEDRSGELWVVSTKGVPRNGAHVTVRGTVRDSFNFGSLGERLPIPRSVASGVVLVEDAHRASY